MDKKTVEVRIYCLCAEILMGKATEDEVKEVVGLAKEYDLLPLVKREFSIIGETLTPQH